MKEIFEFLSYREYLLHFYQQKKEKSPWFSFRLMSQKTGIDAGLLAKVLHGQRHLTEKHIPAIQQLCDFNEAQIEYFRYMILFEKAKNEDQVKMAFEKLLSFREKGAQTIEAGQYEFYKKWHYTAIRSLIDFYDFKENYKELGQKLSPQISAQEAKNAIKLLKELGLIERGIDDKWEITSGVIATGEKWRGAAIKNFQKETLRLASESLDRHEKEERDFSTLSISLNKEKLPEFRAMVSEFRKQIINFVSEQSDEDAVYQMNIQLFPMSK